jgi:outer membrane protein OmpA-like peptidoglycan-associated protein
MAQRARAGGTVHVYGHADDAGSEWANHDLSIDRADRVARALRAAGVPAGRIRAHGAGDQYPLGPAGSLRNRRVELALHGSSQ